MSQYFENIHSQKRAFVEDDDEDIVFTNFIMPGPISKKVKMENLQQQQQQQQHQQQEQEYPDEEEVEEEDKDDITLSPLERLNFGEMKKVKIIPLRDVKQGEKIPVKLFRWFPLKGGKKKIIIEINDGSSIIFLPDTYQKQFQHRSNLQLRDLTQKSKINLIYYGLKPSSNSRLFHSLKFC